jgi:hypothetical protein
MIPLPFKKKPISPPPRRFQYDPNRKLQIIDVTDDPPTPLMSLDVTYGTTDPHPTQTDKVRLRITVETDAPRTILPLLLQTMAADERANKKVG